MVYLIGVYKDTNDKEVKESIVQLLRERLNKADPLEEVVIRRFMEELANEP